MARRAGIARFHDGRGGDWGCRSGYRRNILRFAGVERQHFGLIEQAALSLFGAGAEVAMARQYQLLEEVFDFLIPPFLNAFVNVVVEVVVELAFH